MAEKLSKEALRVIAGEMAGLSGREAKRKAETLAKDFGCDVSMRMMVRPTHCVFWEATQFHSHGTSNPITKCH